jgi:VWFA-related protein
VRLSRWSWLPTLLALVVGAGTVLQGQAPGFRSGVGLVQVPVIVRGDDGQPVRGLPAEAFAVFEAGRRMQLVGAEEIRREASSDAYVPREVLLVVDDMNTRPEIMPRATEAARALIDRLDPRDRVALFNTASQPSLRVDFTTTRTPLRQALARVRGQDMPDEGFSWWRGRQGLTLVRGLLDQLRRQSEGHRRVTLVLFTEGYGIEPAEQAGIVDRSLLEDVRTIVGLAAQANVAIYAIDPSGLDMGRGVSRATGSRPVGPVARMRRAGMPIASSLSAPDDPSALGALAHDTGGRLTRWTNDLLANVPAMLADADEYYLLTYEMPGATDRDRQGGVPHVRQIDVRVHRPGVTVRARQGYVHPLALS